MLNYNAPTLTNGGTASSIDGTGNNQMATFFWLKKAIIQARKEQFFMPLASVTNMPKHFGKTIKVFEYVPLLDDRNSNSQGLDAAGATYAKGNLYGSSRDIGSINARLPVLGENGGRVNRVGFTRIAREGSIYKFGFFHEFNQESMDFDSDDEIMDHLSRELLTGATQLTEAVLQRDLLLSAGVTIYAGAATSNGTVTGEGATPSLVTYANLMRLDQTLTDNRTPKHTTVITGSRNVDTKTLGACRVLFVGSALVPHLRTLKDPFNNPAFIPVQQYGDAGTILNGEIGAIGHFRIVEVPEMLHWAGVGANVGTNPGYRATAGKYDVYPMLCIGEDSFTTIGFQTDGKTVKFTVMTKMPGRETADRTDPYGESGFSSIKWYYGILIKRPERIAIVKTVAPF
jgi:N4-gp56 family major capsid protein